MEDENQPSPGLRKHWWIAGACIALFVCAGLILPNVLRKDAEWVARDVFRESYRQHATEAERQRYEHESISCLLLSTSREVMLDDLVSRPINEGDVLSNANTLIFMGKVRDGQRMGRGLYVAKHRGSRCGEEIVPYQISDTGLVFESGC